MCSGSNDFEHLKGRCHHGQAAQPAEMFFGCSKGWVVFLRISKFVGARNGLVKPNKIDRNRVVMNSNN